MRRVARPADLPAALVAGSREARRRSATAPSTSSGRSCRRATSRSSCLPTRTGTVVALGERDCSLQRRHQKLVEEAPAPGLTRGAAGSAPRAGRPARRRRRDCATPRRASSSYDTEGHFWFLEVNTRLQVEHGVTELVAGVDIVREQFWIAAGRPLSTRGHGRRAGRARDARLATRSRSGSPRRTLRARSRRRPDAWVAGSCRPGPGSASTPRSRLATSSRRNTTT